MKLYDFCNKHKCRHFVKHLGNNRGCVKSSFVIGHYTNCSILFTNGMPNQSDARRRYIIKSCIYTKQLKLIGKLEQI